MHIRLPDFSRVFRKALGASNEYMPCGFTKLSAAIGMDCLLDGPAFNPGGSCPTRPDQNPTRQCCPSGKVTARLQRTVEGLSIAAITQ